MSPLALLLAEWLIVLVAVVALGGFIRHRYGPSWLVWLWGAAAFLLAQAFRLPLLNALLVALHPRLAALPQAVAYGVNVSLLALSAGLFEESARYLVLRWGARRARGWADGVMFGAGHGGIEAILVIGLAVVNAYVLLTAPDLVIARVQATAPEQVEAVRQSIEALQRVGWTEVGLALWERAIAITAHMALSLLVLHTVRTGKLWGWGVAVLGHAGLNATVLLGLRWAGPVAAEGIGTLWALGGLAVILRFRQTDRPNAPSAPGSPATA